MELLGRLERGCITVDSSDGSPRLRWKDVTTVDSSEAGKEIHHRGELLCRLQDETTCAAIFASLYSSVLPQHRLGWAGGTYHRFDGICVTQLKDHTGIFSP